MSLQSFQSINELLAQFDLMRTSIGNELKQIQSDHEAVLKELARFRQNVQHQHTNFDVRRIDPIDDTLEHCLLTRPSLNSYGTAIIASRPRTGFTMPLNGQAELSHPKLDHSQTVDIYESEHEEHPQNIPLQSENLESRGGRLSDYNLASSDSMTKAPASIWPTWIDEVASRSSICRAANSESSSKKGSETSSEGQEILRAGDEMKGGACAHSVVMRPSSPHRVAWDMLSILSLGYDVLLLPLHTFDLPETAFSRNVTVASTVFWSVDMWFSFTTGFHNSGFLEMRMEKIAERYLRSWFAIDFSVLAIDYILIFAAGSNSSDYFGVARIGKAVRIARILRMFRLLRMLKAITIFSEWNNVIFSEALSTCFGIAKLVIVIVLVNHFLACGWHAVGVQLPDGDSNTWVKKLEAEDNADVSFGWLYTSSLHWSITQFTPASMEIVPCNVYERCYAIGVIIFALISFSSFISSITSAMTHLRSINLEHLRQQELIRRYITQNKVSLDLGNRIQTFLKQSRQIERHKKRIHETQVAAFLALPDTLRKELHGQVFMPVLEKHPFFHNLLQVDEPGLLNVCHTSLTEHALQRGQELFTEGDVCTKMYFVLTGKLAYFGSLDISLNSQLSSGNHVCEMVLWVHWDHHGRLSATENCEMVGLDSHQFRAVACKTNSYQSCKSYAHQYAQRINDNMMAGFTLADAWFEFDVCLEMAQRAFEIESEEPEESGLNRNVGLARVLSRVLGKDTMNSTSMSSISTRSSQDSSIKKLLQCMSVVDRCCRWWK